MSATCPGHTLFVYGTLRPRCRHPMAEFLQRRGEFRSVGQIAGRLYDLGRFPAAVRSSIPGDVVRGDLFRIDDETLRAIDVYEGAESSDSTGFRRRMVDVTLPGGDGESAWVYWFEGELPGDAIRIPSGEYERVFAPSASTL